MTEEIPECECRLYDENCECPEANQMANFIIGGTAGVGSAWSIISLFVGPWIATPISYCGFKFESWACAGYSLTWVFYWIVGLGEITFWII